LNISSTVVLHSIYYTTLYYTIVYYTILYYIHLLEYGLLGGEELEALHVLACKGVSFSVIGLMMYIGQ
jgi:hypothetical protein